MRKESSAGHVLRDGHSCPGIRGDHKRRRRDVLCECRRFSAGGWASRDQVEALRLCREAQPLLAMMEALGRTDRTKFRDAFVKPLIEAGLLELTIPDKPQSRLQRYRLTKAGMKTVKLKGK